MNKKILSLICFTLLGIFSTIAVNAQEKFDTAPENIAFNIKSVAYGELRQGNGFLGGDLCCYEDMKLKEGTKVTIGIPTDTYFQFKSCGGGWYNIALNSCKGYLDVTGGKNGDGVRIQIYKPNGSVSQKFRLVHQGDGRYKIFTYWGRILSTVGQSVEAGAEINTWTDHNSTTAEWYFLDLSGSKNVGKKYMPVTPSEEKKPVMEIKPYTEKKKKMIKK